MSWSISETLAFIEPHVPAELISPNAFSRVKTIGHGLPNAISSYYLECRLGPQTSQVDFLACAVASQGDRDILTHQEVTSVLRKTVVWQRLKEFFGLWAQPTGAFHQQVPFIWLEFDRVNDSPAAIPPPSLCLGLEPSLFGILASSQSANTLTAQTYQQVIDTILPRLLAHPLPSEQRRHLLSCFDLLPPGSHLMHLSVMLARQPIALKVTVRVPKHELASYLTRVGWSGSISEIETIVSIFCATVETIQVDLLVGDSIGPTLGFEFFSNTPPQLDSERRFVLDPCVKNGLCTIEKRQALFNWLGSSRVVYAHQTWPTRLVRWFDMKLVYQPDGPLAAKAYLGFMPRTSFA